jgi:hypothetical protein
MRGQFPIAGKAHKASDRQLVDRRSRAALTYLTRVG